jgi:hypothetical protein
MSRQERKEGTTNQIVNKKCEHCNSKKKPNT